ncbi:hypothetical protein PAP_03635 [Palaeococcus pacificus DY20341]|uniref:DUF4139 domain-containing protein n=1 Tax=Palaeococcus pacificus DY20341 TaxID=1343739 RepID=A0A075LT76_9EURY|nr:hypothetical protein [Palaeococcus pacificus]AIF69147.1 hypothetical protein PAP_03635 [Palaeococcus pacificus DY20341]
MKRKTKILITLPFVLILLAMVIFQGSKAVGEGGSLVLYDSAKIGVVEKEISFELKRGINEVPLEELDGLNIAELTLKPVDEGVEVLGVVSQGFDVKSVFDANIGETVEVKLKSGETISGKFLGYKDGKIAIEGDGYYLIDPQEMAYFKVSKLNGEAKARTYAVIKANEDGKYKFKLIYRVSSMGWSSRYKLYLSDSAFLQGYVLIDNPTNKSFEDIDVLLVSGDVSFYQPPIYYRDFVTMAKAEEVVGAQVSEPQKLEAFYLYKLGQIDVNSFEKKLIPYVAQESPFEREYLYESYPYGGSSDIYEIISLKADKVLPAGIVEIYKEMEGKSVLIGEQWIDHTPKGDTLRLKLGKDIDLKGETKVLDERHYDRGAYYKIQVTIENFGEDEKEVIIRHYKWRGKILSSSESPIEETANYVDFKVTVKPGEKESVTFEYEVSY